MNIVGINLDEKKSKLLDKSNLLFNTEQTKIALILYTKLKADRGHNKYLSIAIKDCNGSTLYATLRDESINSKYENIISFHENIKHNTFCNLKFIARKINSSVFLDLLEMQIPEEDGLEVALRERFLGVVPESTKYMEKLSALAKRTNVLVSYREYTSLSRIGDGLIGLYPVLVYNTIAGLDYLCKNAKGFDSHTLFLEFTEVLFHIMKSKESEVDINLADVLAASELRDSDKRIIEMLLYYVNPNQNITNMLDSIYVDRLKENITNYIAIHKLNGAIPGEEVKRYEMVYKAP